MVTWILKAKAKTAKDERLPTLSVRIFSDLKKSHVITGTASEGASPGPVRRRVSDKSGVAIAGGNDFLITTKLFEI